MFSLINTVFLCLVLLNLSENENGSILVCVDVFDESLFIVVYDRPSYSCG